MTRMGNSRALLVAAAASAFSLSAVSAQATDLRLLSSWDRTYAIVPSVTEAFMDMVAEASDGDTTITMIGPEAVPPFEQMQPVANGVFDMLFTSGAYHANTLAVGMVMDAVPEDPELRRSSGLWDEVDAAYQAEGLKLISMPSLPNGYHFLLREPISEDCTLDGRRIRASSTYTSLVQHLGAQATVLPPNEIYSALERGIVDGAAWPVIGALDYGWHEVADYFFRPAFGTASYLMLMNLDLWNSLDEAEQTLLIEQGEALEHMAVETLVDVAGEEETALIERGMSATEICPESADTIESVFAAGLWDLGVEMGGDQIQALRDTAAAAGLEF